MKFAVPADASSIVAIVQDNDGWLLFERPALVIRADHISDVRDAVAEVERLTRDRALHAVGFLTYEASEAFQHTVRPARGPLPPAWFALFGQADVTQVG